jgi:hypothetical protein
MFRHDPAVSAMEASVCQEETLDEVQRKKMRRRRKILMTELGFFYPHQACFIYKHILMGLHRITAHNIPTVFYILHRADDKEA